VQMVDDLARDQGVFVAFKYANCAGSLQSVWTSNGWGVAGGDVQERAFSI
jgi:hypothetical protein